MSAIKFKIAAKTDVGLVRTNNEDNLQVSRDLSVEPMRWVNDEMVQLGEYGSLLVVADGMGGANAGEVASQIAMDTMRREFAPALVKNIQINNTDEVNAYIKRSIVAADNAIKEFGKTRPETKGMGTTIVVAWLIKDKLYVGWCGDSRAYIYNPSYGLVRLTKDHSYVQQLVDAGKISEEDAFDFPESNIITRCLSESTQRAIPDTLPEPVTVSNEDIILLCTDGLCGMIRDNQIEQILREGARNMTELANNLITGALKASGSDNVTVVMCKICSGARPAPKSLFANEAKALKKSSNNKKIIMGSVAGLAVLLLVGIGWIFMKNTTSEDEALECAEMVEANEQILEDISDNSHANASETAPADSQDNDGRGITTGADIVGALSGLNTGGSTPREGDGIDEQGEGVGESSLIDGNNSDPDPAVVETPEEDKPEIIEITYNGESMMLLLKAHKMSRSEFKELNPTITDINNIEKGTNIKLYNRKK